MQMLFVYCSPDATVIDPCEEPLIEGSPTIVLYTNALIEWLVRRSVGIYHRNFTVLPQSFSIPGITFSL